MAMFDRLADLAVGEMFLLKGPAHFTIESLRLVYKLLRVPHHGMVQHYP